MISVVVPLHHFEQQTTPDVLETYSENLEHKLSPLYSQDQEMADSDNNSMPILVGNEYDDQDTYSAEIESTVVEPPQSDAVLTHAPSSVLDEMEYLDEIDYEEADEPDSKQPIAISVINESEVYKVNSLFEVADDF